MIGKKINQLATELAPVSTDLTIIGDPTTGVSKKITLAQLGAIFSGAVSFYTNLAGFPAVGDINVIYCAKDTQKLYLWSGSAYVEVFPSQALLDTYQLRSEKGNANGYASLDSQGKVPISQLPSSIMEYKGTWNASTNTPTLANGTGDTGDVYICNVAGTVNFGAGAITFAVGDYVIYSGTIWQRSSGAVGTVTSVAASITGNSVTISGSPVTTSGTLAFAFAGTGAQYIKGDGTLATFPNTIDQAKNLITEVYNSTGATLTKGTVVYINGGQGNLPTVTKALATGDSTSAQTFGVVQADITNNNNGYVVVAGKLSDLDTQAYTEGTQLYLSATTAGAWTSTKQYAPNHLVYIGIVVRAHPTQGIVEVKIQNGYELDELHNVAAQTPTNNDGLFWEASTSLWKNKSIATILGYTPQAQLNGTGFVKASGTTITYDNSTYLTTSAAATTYLPLVLSSTANVVDINGQQFNIWGSAGGFTSGRIIVDPVFSAIGYQNAGVFDGLKILTNGNAEFSNSGITRFFNQVRFDSTLTDGTYTYTLPGASGTIALVGGAGVGTVTSVGLSSATSGVTIGSTPITTSGTITLAIATASGSQQGLLSSTDWTTFNNKQNALTNPVTGTGTTNYLPKFTGTSTIGNSAVSDDGTTVTLNSRALSGNAATFSGIVSATSGDIRSLGTANDSVTAGPFISVRDTSNAYQMLMQLNASYGLDIWSFGGTWNKRLTLTASGNLGLGVTPSAWGSGTRALQVGSYGALAWSGGIDISMTNNAYYDGTNWVYIASQEAGRFLNNRNTFAWFQAAAGTAGNAISFTQAMTLNASGFLGIGETNPTSRLHIQSSASGGQNIRVVTSVAAGRNYMQFANGSGDMGYIGYGGADGKFYINNQLNDDMLFVNNGATRFTIASTGAATFSSRVNVNGAPDDADIAMTIKAPSGAGKWILFGRDSSDIARFQVSSAGAATFSSSVTTGGNVLIPAGSGLAWSGDASRIMTPEDNVSGALIQTPGIIRFNAGGSEKVRITSGGNVGIGTTSPDRALTVNGQIGINNDFVSTKGGQVFRIGYEAYTSTGGVNLFTEGAIPLVLGTSSTERMRITSGGAVGIKTTPSSGWGSSMAALQIGTGGVLSNWTGANNNFTIGVNAYDNGAGSQIRLYTGGVSNIGFNEDVITFSNAGSSSAGTTISYNERMRITSGGSLLVGKTSVDWTVTGIQTENNSKSFGITADGSENNMFLRKNNATGNVAQFWYNSTSVGTISISTTATSYNTSSDYRLKTDYKDFSGLDLVSKIKAYDYEWKSDKSRSYGVIAHELQSVINYAVTGVKDGKEMQGVDYSKIVPVLIKAIQELNDKIK